MQWPRTAALLLVVVACGIGVRAERWPEVLRGDTVVFPLGDAYYHLRRAELSLAHPGAVLVFDPLVNHPDGSWIPWPPLHTLLLAAAGSLAGGVNRWFYTQLSGRILFGLREQVYAHLQRLSPAFYARNRGGDLLARLDGDVAEIQRFALDSLFAAISGVFGLAGTLLLMIALSPGLTLVALAVLPIEWLWLRGMRARVRERAASVRGPQNPMDSRYATGDA